MSLIRKIKVTYLFLGIIILFFLLRLPSLTYQPVFADEAIYIRWAQIAKAEPTLRFISLQDGKTPLYMWLMAPNLLIFEDPLLAGRLLSVISGLFTLLGVFQIGRKFFDNRAALLGAFLVAVAPFMIFFDRMALVDSMLSAFTIWSVYFGLKLAHHQSIKTAVILGVLLGGAWLTKTPGVVNIALLPLFLLFFNFNPEPWPNRLLKFSSYFGLAAVIAGGLYLIQKIDPNFHQLSARNSDYIHPWSRLLQYPFDPLIPHFKDTVQFSLPFFGPLLILIPGILIIPFWGTRARKLSLNKVALLILIWALLPMVYELQFIKAFTARYIMSSIPLLIVLGGLTISRVMDWGYRLKLRPSLIPAAFVTALLAVFLFWSGYFSLTLDTDLNKIPLSSAERRGYLEDWTAGYGLKEIAAYLIQQSQNQVIVVGTEGSFGTLPDGLLIYLDRYFHQSAIQKIIVLGGKNYVSDTVRDFSSEKPTFFVANKSRYPLAEPGLELISQYPKVIGPDLPPDAILFYKVNPLK